MGMFRRPALWILSLTDIRGSVTSFLCHTSPMFYVLSPFHCHFMSVYNKCSRRRGSQSLNGIMYGFAVEVTATVLYFSC